MAKYVPSPRDWVREQVELYESSGGTKGTTLRDTGLPVVIVTHQGNKTGAIRSIVGRHLTCSQSSSACASARVRDVLAGISRRGRDETSASTISASGSGRCRAIGGFAHRQCPELSRTIGARDRAISARRRDRCLCAAGCSETERAARKAVLCRQCRRRQRQHRQRLPRW